MLDKLKNILLIGAATLLIILCVTPAMGQTPIPQNSSNAAISNPTTVTTGLPSLSSSSSTSQSPTTLDIINSIATIATPLIVLMLTGLGWSIRNRVERAKELEEKLREDRVQIYNDILEPFIMLFTKGKPSTKNQKNKTYQQLGAEKIMSLEYKQAAFKLSLIGSDEVLRSYNDLMQFFYDKDDNAEGEQAESPLEMLALFGRLLLGIRKSVGNESTLLNDFEMLEFLITDLRKFQENGKYPSV